MNIGIDIDGVLIDVEKYELTKGKEYFGFEASNLKGYEIRDKFGVSHEEGDNFWNQHIVEYLTKSEVRKYASIVTNKLHEEGYNITIITARNYSEHYKGYIKPNEIYEFTENWLKENNIHYDKIYFTEHSKTNEVKENKLDYMIEDSPKNIQELSKLTKIIVFDANCNKDLIGFNIMHATNWKEIYKIITSKEI